MKSLTQKLPFYRTRLFLGVLVLINLTVAGYIYFGLNENVSNITELLQIISISFGSPILWIIFNQQFPLIPTIIFHIVQVFLLLLSFLKLKRFLLSLVIFTIMTLISQIITVMLLGSVI